MSAYNMEKYAGFTDDQFSMWVIQNYPQLSQAQAANDAAAAAYAAAAAAMSGPKAAMVGRYMSALNSANGLTAIPG